MEFITEFIIGRRQQLAKVTINTLQVGESVTLTPASEVKDLGCWFDGHLKMDTHVNNICKAAFFHLFNVKRIRVFLSVECTEIVVNAFVTSRLDNCNSLLYGLPNNQLHKSNVRKMQLHVLSAMLVDSIILLLLCTVFTGYLLLILEYSLKFYFLSLNGSLWTCPFVYIRTFAA